MDLRTFCFRAPFCDDAAVAVADLPAGCTRRENEAGRMAWPARVDHVAHRLALGNASLAPRVHGLTLLVVGASWARSLGVGAAAADRGGRNEEKNDGVGG